MAPAEKLFGKSYLKDIDDVTKAMGHVGADIRCLIVPWELDGRTPEEAGRPDDAGLVDRGGGDGESEKYAAEEFRERREDIRKDNHLLVNSALCNATGPANKKRHEMAAFPG